jgi:hypothetical protein
MELTPVKNQDLANAYVDLMRFKKDMTQQQIIRASLALETKNLDGLKAIKAELNQS